AKTLFLDGAPRGDRLGAKVSGKHRKRHKSGAQPTARTDALACHLPRHPGTDRKLHPAQARMAKRTPFISRCPRPFSARRPLQREGGKMTWGIGRRQLAKRQSSAVAALLLAASARAFCPSSFAFLCFSSILSISGDASPPSTHVVGEGADQVEYV